MPYTIEISSLASGHLSAIKKFYRIQIIEAISEQLPHEPVHETKRRKMLPGAVPSFEHRPPVWELRVGHYRVFYDVDEELKTVSVRAVLEKPPHATTEEIL
jgi:mRNA-degrading endonuclease RelE of RelBE toxin-antitoxin system